MALRLMVESRENDLRVLARQNHLDLIKGHFATSPDSIYDYDFMLDPDYEVPFESCRRDDDYIPLPYDERDFTEL